MIKYPFLLVLALCLCLSGCFVSTQKEDGSTGYRTMTLGELWNTVSEPSGDMQSDGSSKTAHNVDASLGDLFAELLLPEGTLDDTVATEIMKFDKRKMTFYFMRRSVVNFDDDRKIIKDTVTYTLKSKVNQIRDRRIMTVDLLGAIGQGPSAEYLYDAITKHPDLSLTNLGNYQVKKDEIYVYRLTGKGKRPVILKYCWMEARGVEFLKDIQIRYDLSPDKKGFAALSRGY